jgi:Bacterial Ig domain
VPPANLTVTATSSNTALVPASGIQITGNGIARAIKVTAAPHQSGETTVDVKVSDGTAEAHKTFKLTVLQVSQTPTGVPDSYSLGSIQSLTVPAASGVLANDTVPADGTLMAEIVSGTSHGVLNLMSNGGFTYTPATGFTGTDTFTYRSRNGSFSSDPVAVTITVLTSRCAPLATVKVTTATVNGKLQATVTAQPVDQQTNNRLVELRFGSFQNGKVTLDGQPIASGATYTPSARATSVTFVVERVTPGQATTIPLTAVDECGAWPTFVGGGSGTGF